MISRCTVINHFAPHKSAPSQVTDEADVLFHSHVQELSANVTEAFIADAMRLENLSREVNNASTMLP